MRAIILLTAAALPLAACDIEKSGKGDGAVEFSAADNGAVAFQVPGVKGNLKLPEAMIRKSDMDIDGVKLMPGSRVKSVRAMDHDVTIGFTSPGSVAAVKEYYARQFAEKKVNAIVQGDGFGGKTRDGDDFTLSLVQTGDATAGTFLIRDKR